MSWFSSDLTLFKSESIVPVVAAVRIPPFPLGFLSQVKLHSTHSGWKLLHFPLNTRCKAVRVEMKGPNQNVRVRQVKLLALPPSSNSDAIVPVEVAHMQSCEQEALKLFRLLTSQVSGRAVACSEQVGRACKESVLSSLFPSGTVPFAALVCL